MLPGQDGHCPHLAGLCPLQGSQAKILRTGSPAAAGRGTQERVSVTVRAAPAGSAKRATPAPLVLTVAAPAASLAR